MNKKQLVLVCSLILVGATQANAVTVLDQAQALAGNLDSTWAGVIGVTALEMMLRAIKTKNPQSLLYMLSNVLKLVAKFAEFGAKTMDSVLQRTKDDQPVAEVAVEEKKAA